MTVKSIIEKVAQKKSRVFITGAIGSGKKHIAKLIHNAIGKQLICIFVNTGFLRKNEEIQVVKTFKKKFKIYIFYVDSK